MISVICNNRFKAVAAVAVLGSVAFARSASAGVTSYSTNFDSMSLGSIDGQEGWSNLSGYAYDQAVVAGVGLGGSQAWKISNDVSDGSVCDISTPTFAAVGDSNAVDGGPAVYNQFSESFWFRTVSTTDDPGLYVSNSLGAPASIRNTWVGIQNDGNGNLIVNAYGVDSSGNFSENPSTAPLSWGQWYEIKETADFIDGANNDQVNYQVLDSNGDVLLNSTINSWEEYYETDPTAEGAPGPVGSDRVTWGLSASPGTQGIYVDDLSLSVSSVPEPASASLLLVGSALLLRRRKRHA